MSIEELYGSGKSEPKDTDHALALPVAEPPTPKMKIRFQEQTGSEVVVVVNPSMPFAKIFKGYTAKRNVDLASVRFLFDGQRINDGDTPKSLQMEENDCVDVLLQQTGG